MYSMMTLANSNVWYIGKLKEQIFSSPYWQMNISWTHGSNHFIIHVNLTIILFLNFTVTYVYYFSIELEKIKFKNTPIHFQKFNLSALSFPGKDVSFHSILLCSSICHIWFHFCFLLPWLLLSVQCLIQANSPDI